MHPQRTRRLATIAAAALVVPLLMLAAPPEALACSCAPAELPEQVERSDVVFTGRVVERSEPSSPLPSSADRVTWTFDVDRVGKGGADDPQQIASARSEASCGVEFVVGRTYLVVADAGPDGTLTTGLCSGTHAVTAPPPAEAPRPADRPPAEAGPSASLVAAGVGALAVAGLAAGLVLRRWRRS